MKGESNKHNDPKMVIRHSWRRVRYHESGFINYWELSKTIAYNGEMLSG